MGALDSAGEGNMILTIEPKGEKGRAFGAECLSYATADGLWSETQTTHKRPIWATFAGPSEALRAFGENLRLGHVARHNVNAYASRGDTRFEFLRSVPYRWWTRPLPAGGSMLSVAHTSLLSWRVPPEESLRYRFMSLPALSWLEAQRFDLDGARKSLDLLIASSVEDRIAVACADRDYSVYPYQDRYKSKISVEGLTERGFGDPIHALIGYGAVLLHYMDHRLPLPIPRDPVFGAWLLLVGHYGDGPVSLNSRIDSDLRRAYGIEVHEPKASGYSTGFTFHGFRGSADRQLKQIGDWLAREVRRWADVVGGV